MRFSHRTLTLLSGAAWLCIGVMLLSRGLKLLSSVIESPSAFAIRLGSTVGGVENAVILIMALALLIGYLKGRLVLRKAMNKTLQRLATLRDPARINDLYGVRHLTLVLTMIAMGVGLQVLGVAPLLRGTVLVAVGSALLQGAMTAFRALKRLPMVR